MITIICATHRPQNQTQKVVQLYKSLLDNARVEASVLHMSELPENFVYADSFGNRTANTKDLLSEKIEPASKLVIIAPEYNGSFPGVFKAFLDGVNPGIWKGKKVALVGVASGRAGNLRGLDHLTGVLHYLRMEVFSLKVPISQLGGLLDDDGNFADEQTKVVLKNQMEEFLAF